MSTTDLLLRVLKFGGTSLADVDRIRGVVDIVRAASGQGRCVVVASAMGGVTASLTRAAEMAARGDEGYASLVHDTVRRQEECISGLVRAEDREDVQAAMQCWTKDLRDLLQGVFLVRECTNRTMDSILSYGELVSSRLVACGLRSASMDAEACDSRALLVTDDTFGQARIDWDTSAGRVRDYFDGDDGVQVVTGFIAATREGETTTLGRGGSDYTAALLGAMLGAERVELWTDVDGVMSADPTLVPDAFSLEALSYDELLELSHFGAKVVYAPSVHPAKEHGIPLLIRNTLRPEFEGTRVGSDEVPARDRLVRGISCIRRVALARLEGDGMVGVPGIAERLFRALARSQVNVILISQASSEHSICFALDPESLPPTRKSIEEEFRLELDVGLIDQLVVDNDRSVVAAVGEGMRDTPGIAGRVFSVLGDLGVNIHAIAQGSSELNISLVVELEDVGRAVRGLHAAFFAPPHTEVQLYLAGVGGVGRALLEQLARVAPALLAERGIALRLVGLARSGKCVLSPRGISADAWEPALEVGEGNGGDLVDAALADVARLRVFVDVTADDVLPESYRALLDAGVTVVAANKRGFSGPYPEYWSVRELRPLRPRAYLETTVGAGLPVLRTVEDLRATGDRIVSIEGVLSGSLSFLFNEVMKGKRFSEAVQEARARGYTEPDPRDDLSGQDVLRKLVILARESGRSLEAADVQLEPILPGEGWDELSVKDFMARLPEVDEYFDARRTRAHASGARLCHLASTEDGAAKIWVAEVEASHPCHGLGGADNLVAIRTERYPDPLVIRGAGAGHEVTAAGVLGDIMRATMDRSSGTAGS